MTVIPERTAPQQPVTLAEAARRFQQLGRGPSRSTLSRDANADRLAQCKDLRGGRARPRYRFRDLCTFYGVDTNAPASAQRKPQHAHPAAGPGVSPQEILALQESLATLTSQVSSLSKVIDSAVRDLDQVRRQLQLKYDAENGMLRQRLELAEARVRQGSSIDSLSREISALRQQVSRLHDQAASAA